MEQWKRILDKVLRFGDERPDRTGVGTVALFGEMLTFDNRTTFPAVTTKKLAFGQVKAELCAFLRGYQTLEQFHSVGCNIWDGNGESSYWAPRQRVPGDLGRIYGVQWRDWHSSAYGLGLHNPQGYVAVDQLKNLVDGLRNDPYSRRHLVTAWNPGELGQMCLPPCHVMFQVFVAPALTPGEAPQLDMLVTMRSVDLFLGLPFDVASYALLQRLLAQTVDMLPGLLHFSLGDAHVYNNHREQVATVLARDEYDAPGIWLDHPADVFNFSPNQAELVNYYSHPAVPAPLNV